MESSYLRETLSFLRKQESRGLQPARNLDPRFHEDKFSGDDIYTRILLLLKIYLELRLNTKRGLLQ